MDSPFERAKSIFDLPDERRVILIDRFWLRVKKSDSCWPWIGELTPQGYGRYHFSQKFLAHRISWEVTNGRIPKGLTIDHLCRNRRCVNPAHMEVVSPAVNTLRGFNPLAQNKRKTNCPRGHPLTEGNLIPSQIKLGWRNCLICRRISQRRYEERKKLGLVKRVIG